MESLLYRVRSEGDVFWRHSGEEDPTRITPNPRQGESATFQQSRGYRDRGQALSGLALRHCCGTFASYPTRLLPGGRRTPAIVPARRRRFPRLSAPTPSVLLGRREPGRMRIGARQSRVQFALFSRLGATSGTLSNQGCFFLSFHNSIMQGCPAVSWSIVIGLGLYRFRIGQIHCECCARPLSETARPRSEERRVGKECRSRWSPY